MWIVPAAALAVVAALLLRGEPDRTHTVIAPPLEAKTLWVGYAEIDTIIAGAAEAFEAKDWKETSRLLSRARFFIESGIREGSFERVPPSLDLMLGLAEYNRGNYDKGISQVTAAAEAEPGSGMYPYYLGWMHLGTGNGGEARKSLERAAALGGRYAGPSREMLERL